MAKKLSGWFRLFIIFASVWTVVAITMFYVVLSRESKEDLDRLRRLHYLQANGMSEKEKEEHYSDIERNYKRQINEYYKARNDTIYRMQVIWLAGIGLVYGLAWCVGWIIRGFQKDKE